jgi:nucleotide-binding universal stress UspA family protein
MKILLPIDGSNLSLSEVRFALQLLHNGLRAQLLLVNIQQPANLYEIVNQPDPAVREKINHEAGLHALEPALQLVREAGVDFEAEVMTGSTASALLDLIELQQCDMVVMGTHGAGLLRSAWEDSVAQDLVHRAPVPVMLVKPEEDPAAVQDS